MAAHLEFAKRVVYLVPVLLFFVIVPLQFITAIEEQLARGKSREAFLILARDPHGVAPKGSFFLRPSLLLFVFVSFLVADVLLITNLSNSLNASVHRYIYQGVLWIRLLIFILFGGEVLIWYQLRLAELKRRAMEDARISGSRNQELPPESRKPIAEPAR